MNGSILHSNGMNSNGVNGTAMNTESIEEELSCIVSGCSDSESDLSFEGH